MTALLSFESSGFRSAYHHKLGFGFGDVSLYNHFLNVLRDTHMLVVAFYRRLLKVTFSEEVGEG